MKVFKKIALLLLAGAMTFGFAACSGGDDGGSSDSSSSSKLPSKTGTNNLSGNAFERTDKDGRKTVIKFSGSTYTVTSTKDVEASILTVAFTDKVEETYSYSFDSDVGVLYSTIKKEKSTILNSEGKVLYTYPEALPSTMAGYRKMAKDMYKAVLNDTGRANPDAIDTLFNKKSAPELYYKLKDYGYTDETGLSDDENAYSKFYKDTTERLKLDTKKIEVIPYRLSGSEISIGKSIENQYPSATEFGDIFNGWYDFSDFSGTGGEIKVNAETFMNKEENILLSSGKKYKIVSASNDKMTVKEVTGKDSDGYLELAAESKTLKLNYSYITDGWFVVQAEDDTKEISFSFRIYMLSVFTHCIDPKTYTKQENSSKSGSSSSSSSSDTSTSTNKNDPFKGTTWVYEADGIRVYTLKFNSDGTSVLVMGMMGIPKEKYTVSKDGNKYIAKCAQENMLSHVFTIDSADAKTGSLTWNMAKKDPATLTKM